MIFPTNPSKEAPCQTLSHQPVLFSSQCLTLHDNCAIFHIDILLLTEVGYLKFQESTFSSRTQESIFILNGGGGEQPINIVTVLKLAFMEQEDTHQSCKIYFAPRLAPIHKTLESSYQFIALFHNSSFQTRSFWKVWSYLSLVQFVLSLASPLSFQIPLEILLIIPPNSILSGLRTAVFWA